MPKDSKPDNSDYTGLKNRLEALETELELSQEILRQAEVELDRKNQIIAALKKRLFGSKSERYNPNQTQFDFGDVVLGKSEETGADDKPSRQKSRVPGIRSKKSDLLPKNMPVVIVRSIKRKAIELSLRSSLRHRCHRSPGPCAGLI